MALSIYSQTGILKATFAPEDNSTGNKGIMDDNILTLTFNHYDCISIDVNDYVDFLGERYWALEKYTPNQKSTVEWEYNLKLYGLESLIKRILVLKLVDNENEPVFSLTAPAIEHVRLFVDNINRAMNTTNWKVGEVIATPNLTVDYAGTFINKGLDEVSGQAETEWWIEGTTVNLSRCEHSAPITLGYRNGLLSINKDTNENAKFFTRLFPVGSSRNIDRATYGFTRLQLPGHQKYVEQNTQYGVIEHFEENAFTHIYPKRIGHVGTVRSEEKTGENGEPFTIYYFIDSGLNFDPNDYELPGLVKNVVFQSGELNGRDFEVNYDSVKKEFEIITQFPYDDDTQLPGGSLVPKSGDEYILYNVRMPNEYYPIAESEFAQAVQTYMEKNKLDKSVYKAPTDYIDLGNRNIELTLGQSVRLESAEFFPEAGYRLSRITRITRKVNNPLQADIEISDMTDRGKMAALEGGIDQTNQYVKAVIGGLPDIIRSWESTLATDTNLFSARMTLLKIAESARTTVENVVKMLRDVVKLFEEALLQYAETISGKFLRKDIHDTAEELITFLKGIEVFGEAVAETLKVKEHAIFLDVLSSENFKSGFPGGTGWALFWKEALNAAEQIEKKSVLELDEVTVRGVMRVYEFVISQLMGENGTRITSDMMHIHSIDPVTKTIYLDTEKGVLYNPFRPGDILMVQQFSFDGGGRTYELRVVTAKVGSMSDGENRLDVITYSHFVGNESDVRPRDVLTRVDSVTNFDRKGIIKTTSVENGAPYMDVLYGMKTDPALALKTRLGRLEGIITYLWGQLKGYGLYAENAYITGEFRLKTGEDVRTRFEVMEGKLQSAMQSIITTLSEKDNYLKNATFKNDMEFWERERDIWLYDFGGDLLDLNINFFSEKNKIADIDSFDGRFMLRIKDSFIRQLNEDISKSEPEDDVYLTIKYYCTGEGHLTAGFAGTEIYTEEDIPVSEGNFQEIVISGLWDGTGDFELHFDGDIYIETLALTTDPLDNYKKEVESQFIQTAESISAEVTARTNQVNGIWTHIYNAGWITTADGNKLWASHTELNAMGDRISLAESSITQLAYSITLKVSQSEFNALGNRVSLAESSITQLANSITLKVNQSDFDALGNRVSVAESSITQLAYSITLKVSQSEFNALGNRVSLAESSITQLANSITLKVNKTDFDALGNRVSVAESSITQLANSITLKVNQSDFNALGNRVSVAESTITQLADSIALKVNKSEFDALGNLVLSNESMIRLLSDRISAEVTARTTDVNGIYSYISSAGWITTADGNLLWASKSLENGETIVSKINQTADNITISAKHIKLEGIVTANSNFKVLLDGSIEAANGKFTGKITATSGKIAGFNINGDTIVNDYSDPSNMGAIIFRRDSQNIFAGIGANVFPASSGISVPARFENGDTTNMYGTNIGIYASASGGARNYGLWSNAPLIADGFIGKKYGSLDFTNSTWSAADFAKSNILLLYNSGSAKTTSLPSKTQLGSLLGITIDNGFAAMYTLFSAIGSVTFDNVTDNNLNTVSVTLAQGDVLTVIVYSFGTAFRWQKVSLFQ